MAHYEVPELDTKGLRQFGLMLGVGLAVIFGLILPWSWSLELFPNWYWIIAGAVILLWALASPGSIQGLYMTWMRIALPFGNAVNVLILAIVFLLVILPTGVIMRAMGKDPMRRSLDPNAESYRIMSKIPQKNHFERPF